MNALEFLDLVIGLIFIYLIFSIAASVIWEIFVNMTHLKEEMLFNWLKDNFQSNALITNHPLIKGLYKKQRTILFRIKRLFNPGASSDAPSRKPSYISSAVFTDVIIDIIQQSQSQAPAASGGTGIEDKFRQFINEAGGDIKKAKERIGMWYDEAQERLISYYKKSLQLWIFLISALLVGFTNADTINLINYLYNNAEARQALANKAELFVRDSTNLRRIHAITATAADSASKKQDSVLVREIEADIRTLKELNSEFKATGIPLGWNIEKGLKKKSSEKVAGNANPPQSAYNQGNSTEFNWLRKIGGLLLTVFAVSLGSPFWFDILSKLANLRASGNKPKTTIEDDTKPSTQTIILK